MKRLFLLSCAILFFLIVMIGCGNKNTTDSASQNQSGSELPSSQTSKENKSDSESSEIENTKQSNIPTLFIHGYSGTDYTFNGMLSRFESEEYGKQQLTITVQPDGSISEVGDWQEEADNPFIQVLFSDNKNNEWNQADWIRAVLVYLKTTYQIDEVNLVGHSMGGVSSFRYLIAYGNETSQPVVNKLVAIGAPFNDFVEGNESQTLTELKQDGPLVLSGRYSEFSAAIQQYPVSTKMLNVVGDLNDGSKSDGTVSLSSGLSIGYLMQSAKRDYSEKIIVDEQASHSQLHENDEVDALVSEFLWGN
ncbi:MAG: alpha/beta fold hydrolase [Carnobacterium sp.]|uniref:alpha/beta fold hydrolase n=1 Tax=Carnobacterium sp. TaxID=48221 RepID=UPI003C75E881